MRRSNITREAKHWLFPVNVITIEGAMGISFERVGLGGQLRTNAVSGSEHACPT